MLNSVIKNSRDKNVEDYIKRQRSPQKEICQIQRAILFKTFPGIKEEMKRGVPSFSQGKYYFVALKTHVNLAFSLKGLSKKEIALFEGSGETMKHIKIVSLEELNEENIVNLLRLVKNE